MLATLITAGSRSASTQTERGASARSIRRATIRCSTRFLALCRSCSPRWSSTAGSALRRVEPGERDGGRAGAAAPDEQLRAGADEGALAASRRRSRSRTGRRSRRAPNTAAGIVRGGASTAHLACEHHLLELAAADPRAPRRPRSPRSAAAALTLRIVVAPAGCGSSSGSGVAAQRGQPALEAGETSSGSSPGATTAASVSQVLPPSAEQRELRQHQQRRRKRRPRRRRRRRRRRTRSRRSTRGRRRPGGRPAPSATRSRVTSAQSAIRSAKRPGPRETASCADPSPASAKPSRSGCSQAEPAIGGQPRGEDGRDRVGELGLDRDADQRPPAVARARERVLEPVEGGRGVEHRSRP